jgi:hypothetical protein
MTQPSFARRASVFVAFCSLWVGTLVGCSKKTVDLEDLGEVKGTVTFNGKPLSHGAVQFFKDQRMTCVAAIEKDGTYQTPLVPGQFSVAIVTKIEPREIAKLVKEGPPDLVGAPEGRIPQRLATDTANAPKSVDPDSRLPTLASLLEKMPPADRSALEEVQKRFGNPAESGLKVTVTKGPNTHNFDLK